MFEVGRFGLPGQASGPGPAAVHAARLVVQEPITADGPERALTGRRAFD
jgi:hypothetical protein